MFTKKITYTDYNGEERTETFYFNISKAEVMEMQFQHPGGYTEYLERIIEAKDQPSLMEAFTVFITNAYGEKSEDGKRFIKSPELSEAFKQTEAYSELFMELLGDADFAATFIEGILPQVEMTEEQRAELAAKTKALIDSKK